MNLTYRNLRNKLSKLSGIELDLTATIFDAKGEEVYPISKFVNPTNEVQLFLVIRGDEDADAEHCNLTYRDLLNKLDQLPDSELDLTAKLFDMDFKDIHSILAIGSIESLDVDDAVGGTLDEGHIVLAINTPESHYEQLSSEQIKELKVGDTVFWAKPDDAPEEWFIEEIDHQKGTCVVRWNNPYSKNGIDEYFNEDAKLSDLLMKRAVTESNTASFRT